MAGETCPIILMHAQGDPQSMQKSPSYEDVVLDVYDALKDRISACEAAGIDRTRLCIDPGIGFGKTLRHNLALINNIGIFHGLGCPILFGVSRKRFIGALALEDDAKMRLPGSLAAALAGLSQGVHILRVHDVAETRQMLDVWGGLRDEQQMPDALQ
jgi:dihydropteroate synthase